MTKIGFIGLGVMGTPMAAHLLAAGHTLYAHTRSGVPQALRDAGAQACASAAEVARQADTVFLMLPDTPDVERVLFGAGGVAEELGAGKTVVDMSSISPIETRDFAARIEALGSDYVDAPVSGGEVGAKAATLSIMAGADPARVRQALMGGFASSRVLEVHGERMIERRFEPGFRIALHQKDLELALSTARKLGVNLPNTASCQQLFNTCSALGGARWDHAGLVRALEHMASFAIGDKVPGADGADSADGTAGRAGKA